MNQLDFLFILINSTLNDLYSKRCLSQQNSHSQYVAVIHMAEHQKLVSSLDVWQEAYLNISKAHLLCINYKIVIK